MSRVQVTRLYFDARLCARETGYEVNRVHGYWAFLSDAIRIAPQK